MKMREKLVNDLLKSNTCAQSAYCLCRILEHLMELDYSELPLALSEIISPIMHTLMQQYKTQPYAVVTGQSANLLYLLFTLNWNCLDDPRWTIAKLEYLADKFSDAENLQIADTEHLASILAYCLHEYDCVSRKRMPILIVLPDIDIECITITGEKHNCLMAFINSANSTSDLWELFTYEGIALMIAEDEIPEAGLELLARTYCPAVKQLPEETQAVEYMEAIKKGLIFQGPHGQYEIESDHDFFQRLWHEYLKSL